MSAIEELGKKPVIDMTDLEYAVWTLHTTEPGNIGENAALELVSIQNLANKAGELNAALQARVAELEAAIAKFTGCNHGVEINSDGESVWCMRCMDIEHAKVLGECRHCGAKLDENLFCTDCNEGFKE